MSNDGLRDRFLSGDPTDPDASVSVKWDDLGIGLIGSFVLAWIFGIIDVINGVAGWMISSLEGAAAWLVGLGLGFGDAGAEGFREAARSAEPFIAMLGPAAYPVAVGMVVVMLLAVREVFVVAA